MLIFLSLVLPVVIFTFWGLHISGEMEKLTEVRFVEVDMPGRSQFELAKSGEYRIFYDCDIELAGRRYRTAPELPGLLGTLSVLSTNESVTLAPVVGRSDSDRRKRDADSSRVPIWDCRVERGGVFALDVAYPEGGDGPERIVLVVERQLGAAVFSSVASMCWVFPLAGLVFLGGLIGGILMMVMTRVRRGDRQPQLPGLGERDSD